MTTKEKLISHVDHLYNQRLSEVELNKKLESLSLMADWSRKQKQITDDEYEAVIEEMASRKAKKNVIQPQQNPDKVVTVKQKTMPKIGRNQIIIIILILLVALTSLAVFAVQKKNKKVALINPSDVKKEGRALRFHGKLVDSAGNPIDRKVDVVFNLYAQKNDGKPVYTGACTGEHGLVPSIDGTFTVSIGSDCNMKRIPDAIFSKSQGLYMGIQVSNDKELVPRYPIATVQYASNSDKVKGLTLGTNESSIPYIDEEGRLVIGAVSPKLKSTQGEFSIEGETVSVRTNPDTAGSITFEPAEGGNVLFAAGNVGIGVSEPKSTLEVDGSIGLSEDILLNGENTAVYQNQGGSIRFYTSKDITDLTSPALLLASENEIGLATNKIVDTISAGGSISPVENGKFNLGSVTNKWKTIYTNELVMAEEGIGAFWQRKDGKLTPAKNDDDLILGSKSDQNSLIKFSGKGNSQSWINSGAFGIGTSTPHQLLAALGSADNNSISSISNLSKYDTNGTNVLRLNLGTPVSGTSSRFVDFYANSTNDNNGTKVGSIRLQNGAVVYQSNGADFAEYFDLDEPAGEGDIISITSNGKGKAEGEGTLVGVVSNVAGFIGNAKEDKEYKNKTLVGLVGQVKTHVSTLNGPIHSGDRIAATSIPGYGGVQITSGDIVGTVIDSQQEIESQLSGDKCPVEVTDTNVLCGSVTILVSPGYVAMKDNDIYTKLKGTAVIPAGISTLTIENKNISKDTIILLTAISDKPTRVSLTVQKTCEGEKNKGCKPSFTVVSDKLTSESLKFNWLIVN